MNYHPLMGITIFFIFIILAFFLGSKIYAKKNRLKRTIIVNKLDSKLLSIEVKLLRM